MDPARLQSLIARDESLRGLLEARVEATPDKPFILWRGAAYSYTEIDARANAVANSLLACGVSIGDRVAIMMSNSLEWVALWLGAAKVGAVAVTLNTAYKGEGLRYLLGHSRPALLAIDEEFLPRLEALEGPLPDLHVGGGELLDGDRARPPRAELSLRSPCSILYTSGTTGPPKGCLLPQGQYLAAAHLHAENCGYDETTTLYTCLPLFHINAQNYSLLSALAAGGTLALDDRFTASGFWEKLIEVGATAFNFIGSMAISLWNREPRPIERGHGARIAFGVPVPLNIWGEWEERFGVRVIYAYGMTENALPAIFPIQDTPAAPHLRGAAGKASPMAEVAVVDDDDRPLPAGELGEIVTRPMLPFTMMTEYVDRPDATVEAFRNCWFHTGDLGILDADGYLFYVDRKKDALRRRGEMISSWEVEATVGKFPGVAECAAVGVPSDLGEDEVLIAVACAGEPIDPAALIAFCRERTAAHQVPRYVRLVPELPRTQTQRIEKYRLREQGVTADTWDAEHALLESTPVTRERPRA
jgi:crotonobetaine/carnitine-CoA ligase